MNRRQILERWQIAEQELTAIIDENPSLRGFMLGYVAEYKLRSLLSSSELVESLIKPDDHDRRMGSKGDIIIIYRGHRFSIEVKSLQTNSIQVDTNGVYHGMVQVDASDSREVTLPNGKTIKTTCLLVGEFDVVAFNLFQFREQWDFAFALNRDLPRTRYKKYTEEQRQYLLATLVPVTWPLSPPFTLNPFELVDKLIEERG